MRLSGLDHRDGVRWERAQPRQRAAAIIEAHIRMEMWRGGGRWVKPSACLAGKPVATNFRLAGRGGTIKLVGHLFCSFENMKTEWDR